MDRALEPARHSKQRPSKWREVVLVCAKCTAKIGGGFGPRKRTSLRKALRKSLGLKKGRKAAIGVVDAPCFDLCPKKAVTVALGSHPQTLYVIEKGAPIEDVVLALGIGAIAERALGGETT